MASVVRTLTPQETLLSAASPAATPPARHLNLGGAWAGFRLDGLEIDDATHSLGLVTLPGAAVALTPTLDTAIGLAGLAGMAIDFDGNLYVSDAANHAVIRVDGCDGVAAPLPCLRGPGSAPAELHTPRGLAVGPDGGIYIADSGNDRIQVLDLRSQQLRAVIGEPGDAPGEFDDPRAVAVDGDGFLYVVDFGNARLQKLDRVGRPVVSFAETVLAQETAPVAPEAIGVVDAGAGQRLVVVDGGPQRLLAYETSGILDADLTAALSNIGGEVTAIAISHGRIHAGDAGGELSIWRSDGTAIGAVQVFDGIAIAAIASGRAGDIIVRPLAGAPVLKLVEGAATANCGTFLAGPFAAGAEPVRWQRVAMRAIVPEGARVQLFSLTSDTLDGTSGSPGLPAACAGGAAMPSDPGAEATPLDAWRAAPPLGESFLALNAPGRYLWLAGLVRAGDVGSPVIEAIRVEFEHESWIRHLPAVYRRDPAGRDILERVLLLFEDMLDGVGGRIDELPSLFDAYAAPDPSGGGSWLEWLGGWVEVELDERWEDGKRRDTVARAFRAHERRGTLESLRDLIGLYAGAGVHITEPGRNVSLWSLGKVSTLGFDSMLAPAAADGAIVGTTATLGQSHLSVDASYGAPLFERLAHRFCIGVYAVDVPDGGALARVRETVDREKPAHTVYDVCTIDAAMRIGFQARIGIDTIIAGPPGDFIAGDGSPLGTDTLLPQAPGPAAPVLGQTMTIGKGATLL